MKTEIKTIDYYLPEEIVKTRDMMAEVNPSRLGFKETLIEDLIGIREVRHSAANEKPSTLATKAAQRALSKFEGNPDDIDMIIFCGIDRDFVEPSTAHIIQNNLGLKQSVCFDITNACLGFMTGIQVANSAILAGAAKNVLVCTGETPSDVSKHSIPRLKKIVDRNFFFDRIGSLTVGDAGAAAIIGKSEDSSGFQCLNFLSKGELANLCYYLKGDDGLLEGQMLMKQISSAIMNAHTELLPKTLTDINKDSNEIHCLITHQVGKRPWEKYPSAMGMAKSTMTKTFDVLGNITSATFGVNYAQALESGQIKKGDLVMAAMAGSGLSVCQAAIIV